MKGFGENNKAKKKMRKNLSPQSKEQIANLAIKFHSEGNISEASKYYQYFINQGFKDERIFSNYGSILRGINKLKDAEYYFRKSIDLNPNYAYAYSNLGSILRDLHNLKDAELCTRKAIQLNPNFADAYSNLGLIMRDLRNLKDAELCTRKAIQLNPNFADAYSNLGVILTNAGRLNDAELYTRKAIELKPDFAEARSNLSAILIDLGKFKELLLLSKSTLKSNSINKGFKSLASLRITITNLLNKDFSEARLYLDKTNDLINQEAINIIENENDKQYVSAFSQFINSLFPLLKKEDKHSCSNIIPHFGESHCLSFAHETLSISSQIYRIQPILITGGKAWHFANNQNNQWKDSLAQQMKKQTYNDKAFISFGEIDCREDEGILNYAIKNGKDMSEVCKETVIGFVNHMERILSPDYSEKYYFGVPAPKKGAKSLKDLETKRIKIIKLYNSILRKEVLYRGSHFLDVYKLTADNEGLNNNNYMCDNTHLSPKCLSILFEKYLQKS